MTATERHRHLRKRLPRTWHAFFGRFGRLRAIQLATIEPILDGRHVLAMAPTATGKTEAVVAPLLERLLAGRPISTLGLSVLVVAPTRALCNDLRRRLATPLGHVGVSFDIKTGDAPTINLERPPQLLVTTPESLDSLLARQPQILREVGAAMLDELHLIDGTARGDQLRCLLSRLDHLVGSPVQRCGASATIPDADATARRFLGGRTECVAATEEGTGQRPIQAETLEARTVGEACEAITRLFFEAPRRKMLVFANRRADVEATVARLAAEPRLAGRVMAHHGSLSRGERLRVEKRFLNAPSAICVATTTLEIGIDIGDVDRVVLLGPPPDVSSLLQRVGRGNRAEAVTRVLCLYAGAFEARRVAHLLECANRGRLYPDPVPFRPAVVAQQALSLLFQNPRRWISAEALRQRLPPELWPLWSEARCGALLGGLVEAGYLRAWGGGARFAAEETAERAYELGKIHSNIDDPHEIEVLDETTGRSLGTVRLTRRQRRMAASGGDVAVALAGRRREVARVGDRQMVVRSSEGVEDSQFIARQRPRYTFGLARSLAEFLGLERDVMVLSQREQGGWRLYHFLGTLWGRLLGGLLARRGLRRRIGGGPFEVALEAPLRAPTVGAPESLKSELTRVVERHLASFDRLLMPGPLGSAVPDTERRAWVLAALDLRRAAEVLARLRVVEGDLVA